MKRNVWVPLLAAGAVGAVLVGVAAGAGILRNSGSDRPPQLAIGSAAGRDAAAAAESRTADMSMAAASYVLEGSLPAGPTEERVRRFAAGDPAERRQAVAAALGVPADDPNLSLSEDAAYAWSYYDNAYFARAYPAVDCPGQAQIDPQVDTPTDMPTEVVTDAPAAASAEGDARSVAPTPGCPVATPAVLPDGPSREAALAIAAPVLEALGVSADQARVEVGAPTTWVSVDPSVGGLPTRGLTTSLEVSSDGIVGGNGYVGSAERGEAYPLISAQTAYEQLANQPMPEIAMLCPEPAPAGDDAVADPAATMPACGPIEPTVITGAELGLTLQYEGVEPLLVPSWLFLTADAAQNPWGPTVIAVDPAYIAEPAPVEVPVDPDTPVEGGGSNSGSGFAPGSPGTVDPVPAPTPVPEPEQIPYAVADGAALAVVWYNSSSCTRELVLEAEAPDSVTVTLSKLPPETACTADAVVTKGSVTLAEPLGRRAVVFESTAIPVR